MPIRKISLLLPTHVKPQHFGQTPLAYSHKIMAKFETALKALSPALVRHQHIQERTEDPQTGPQWEQRVQYDVWVDVSGDDLAPLVQLVLSSLDIKSFTAFLGDDYQRMTLDACEEIVAGLHVWCEE